MRGIDGMNGRERNKVWRFSAVGKFQGGEWEGGGGGRGAARVVGTGVEGRGFCEVTTDTRCEPLALHDDLAI